MANATQILIAEDDENDRFLIRRAFTKAGVNLPVHFVKDGQEAVDYLQSCAPCSKLDRPRPALLLLDLKMPRLDGFQVLEWLTGSTQCKPTLVIVFTSSSDPRDKQRAADLGADGYVIKPHDGADYISLVQDLIRQLSSLGPACGPTQA
jgi:CheY-like chemotaxis protein